MESPESPPDGKLDWGIAYIPLLSATTFTYAAISSSRQVTINFRRARMSAAPLLIPSESPLTLTPTPTSTPTAPSPPTVLTSLHEHDEDEVSWATGFSRRRSLAQLASINTRAADRRADHLLPLLSPIAQSAQSSPDRAYFPGQQKSLEGIAIRSFCLGVMLALSVTAVILTLVFTSSPLWRLPFFIGALSTFHFLEFWTTAKYNTPVANIGSFLLTANWPAYAIAHMMASLECLTTKLLFPNRSWAPLYSGHFILLCGFIMVIGGQFVRSAAMVQAGQSFNHTVQYRKKDSHNLVTTGLYSFLRHPAYFGFFYWGIGTQMVLGNPFCFVGYTIVLWQFFSKRVRHEEALLVRFFGDEYINYKNKVGTLMPFVGS
ncbi:farnesyl cysteine-carboxyl methyltransferase [Parahypoxylon ruwenzoriense]